jgi:hypothetical protein
MAFRDEDPAVVHEGSVVVVRNEERSERVVVVPERPLRAWAQRKDRQYRGSGKTVKNWDGTAGRYADQQVAEGTVKTSVAASSNTQVTATPVPDAEL